MVPWFHSNLKDPPPPVLWPLPWPIGPSSFLTKFTPVLLSVVFLSPVLFPYHLSSTLCWRHFSRWKSDDSIACSPPFNSSHRIQTEVQIHFVFCDLTPVYLLSFLSSLPLVIKSELWIHKCPCVALPLCLPFSLHGTCIL